MFGVYALNDCLGDKAAGVELIEENGGAFDSESRQGQSGGQIIPCVVLR
jgi:hypothetical protein